MNRSTTKKAKSPLLSKLAVFAVALVVGVCAMGLAMPQAAYADSWSISGWKDGRSTSYSSIIASVILSKSSDSSSAAVSLSLEDLSRYPQEDDGALVYGRLTDNTRQDSGGEFKDATRSGGAAARYARSLYQYHWIEVMSNDGDVDSVSGVSTGALMPASLGSAVYGLIYSIVDNASKSLLAINPINVFRINVGNYDTGLGNVETGNGADGGTISGMIIDFFVNLGVNEQFIHDLMRIGFAVIIGLFVLTLIIAFVNVRNRGGMMGKAKGYGIRAITIIAAIPLAIVLTDGLTRVATELQNNSIDQLEGVTDGIILDSLEFAGDTNLDLGYLISSTNGSGTKALSGAAGNTDNVKKINEVLAGINVKKTSDDDTDGLPGSETSALSLLGAFMSRETANINDYFGWIESGDVDIQARWQGIAPGGNDDTLSSGVGDSYDSTFTMPDDIVYVNSKGSDAESDGQRDGGYEEPDNANDITKTFTMVKGDGTAQNFYAMASDAYSTSLVRWNKPSTYIYGGSTAGNVSEQDNSVYSFIFDGNPGDDSGSQAIDPTNGAKITSWDAGSEDSVWWTNAIARAFVNMRAGVWQHDGSNLESLSTQTVTFLLQSEFQDDSLQYRAYNSAGTEESARTNKGEYGNVFIRYVIPRANSTDLAGKLATLNVVWVAAGAAAVLGGIALISGPVLGSIFAAFKGFFKALVTGDIFGLAEYALYELALFLSFIFFNVSILAGVAVVSAFSALTDFLTSTIGNINTSMSQQSDAWVIGPLIDMFNGIINSIIMFFVMLALCAIVVLILSWPVTTLRVNNMERQVNIVSLFIFLPYAFVEAITGRFDMYRSRLYGTQPLKLGSGNGAGVAGAHAKKLLGLGLGAAAVGTGIAGAGLYHGVKAMGAAGRTAGEEGATGFEKAKAMMSGFGAGAGSAVTGGIANSANAAKSVMGAVQNGGIAGVVGATAGAARGSFDAGTMGVLSKDGVKRRLDEMNVDKDKAPDVNTREAAVDTDADSKFGNGDGSAAAVRTDGDGVDERSENPNGVVENASDFGDMATAVPTADVASWETDDAQFEAETDSSTGDVDYMRRSKFVDDDGNVTYGEWQSINQGELSDDDGYLPGQREAMEAAGKAQVMDAFAKEHPDLVVKDENGNIDYEKTVLNAMDHDIDAEEIGRAHMQLGSAERSAAMVDAGMTAYAAERAPRKDAYGQTIAGGSRRDGYRAAEKAILGGTRASEMTDEQARALSSFYQKTGMTKEVAESRVADMRRGTVLENSRKKLSRFQKDNRTSATTAMTAGAYGVGAAAAHRRREKEARSAEYATTSNPLKKARMAVNNARADISHGRRVGQQRGREVLGSTVSGRRVLERKDANQRFREAHRGQGGLGIAASDERYARDLKRQREAIERRQSKRNGGSDSQRPKQTQQRPSAAQNGNRTYFLGQRQDIRVQNYDNGNIEVTIPGKGTETYTRERFQQLRDTGYFDNLDTTKRPPKK